MTTLVTVIFAREKNVKKVHFFINKLFVVWYSAVSVVWIHTQIVWTVNTKYLEITAENPLLIHSPPADLNSLKLIWELKVWGCFSSRWQKLFDACLPLSCLRQPKTLRSGGEVVTSPPLNRKVGCSRPTMIRACWLRVRKHYPAQKNNQKN